MSKAISVKKVLILVIILALPGFLYYLLQEKGENRYRKLPVFGAKRLAGTFHTRRGEKIPDTIYHTITDFKLVNQAGDTVRFPADSNRITVVNFFFTRCPGACHKMNKEMQRVEERFRANNLVRFFSVSVDPNDKPEVLSKYASTYNARAGKWDFLTGESDKIYDLARNGFLVDAFKDSTKNGNFIHSPLLILVDPQKRIRGFYDSSSKEQVDKLIDEVKVLIAEELRERL